MKPILFSLLLISGTSLLLSATCNRDTNTCPGDVICTEIFNMVMVKVNGPEGVPPSFDDVYTLRHKNHEIIRTEPIPGSEGRFTVLDDNYQKKLANQQDTFTFIAIKNGKMVIEEPYVISADCCHIKKVSGKDEISY